MNIDEIEKLLFEASGSKVCPICGTPFRPYHSRQKTCASKECKRKYHSNYVVQYNKKRRKENPEAVRAYTRNQMRRYRARKKYRERLDDAERYWKEREANENNITGVDYGKRQAEKTLSQVPKIDVNLERGEKDDNVHHKDK